ncbi:MAG: hypothetical protein GY749_20540 [Desulfobacteraceae bacterium]|nr:hypothetical protein [Desulfobacteraceae bacterium]
MKKNNQAIETVVPDEVYTDRQEFIDYFYNTALNAIGRRSMSAVLLGHRRMGKTEIFKRVVNRLFFEQDYKDPDALVPVFFEFPDEVVDKRDFALKYTANFIRWYAAFRLNDPGIISGRLEIRDLISLVEKSMKITKGFKLAVGFAKALVSPDAGIPIPEQDAVNLPRNVAFTDDSTIAMFLDEFQNTRLPHHDFSITGFFQQAVESPRCPHFVTGSAMSILADDMVGRGALYGRFDYEHISPLTDYWGSELVLSSARYYRAELAEIMAPVISDRCGGNPFYITAVIRQAAKQGKKICDEEALSRMLAVDISSGFIWGELSDQVNRWIERVNKHGITKWILYLAALEQGEEISLERIQGELKKHEGTEISLRKIKEVLVKLARGDLLEYKAFGNWFGKVNDPILNEFLRVWGETEVERQNAAWVRKKTVRNLSTIERRFHDYKGYLAEVFMIQILWNSQGKRLPGNISTQAAILSCRTGLFLLTSGTDPEQVRKWRQTYMPMPEMIFGSGKANGGISLCVPHLLCAFARGKQFTKVYQTGFNSFNRFPEKIFSLSSCERGNFSTQALLEA